MNDSEVCYTNKTGDSVNFDSEAKNPCAITCANLDDIGNEKIETNSPSASTCDPANPTSAGVIGIAPHVGDGDTNQQVTDDFLKERATGGKSTDSRNNETSRSEGMDDIAGGCLPPDDKQCQYLEKQTTCSDNENESRVKSEQISSECQVEMESASTEIVLKVEEENLEDVTPSFGSDVEEGVEICSSSNKHNDLSLQPNGLTEDTLAKLQPIHQQLQTEMISLQWKCKQQAEQISQLQRENKRLNEELDDKVDTPPEIYEVQMEALENTISSLQRENASWQEKLMNHDEVAKKTIANLKLEFGAKLDKMSNLYETANREKEVMVIKYAHGEKDILTLKKLQEDLEKKLRESGKERDSLLVKLKNLNIERTRLCQALDKKTADVNILQRENDKMKEQLSSKDIKIKWAQNKLRTEMDAHKETEVKLERLQYKLKETREEAEQIRKDCQEMIRTYQESEDVRSNSLDIQLKEKETELKAERQEKTDQEEVYHSVRKELEIFKKKQKLSLEETNNLLTKIKALESERLEYETNTSSLKESLNAYKQEIIDLTARMAEMENLKSMVCREKEKGLVNHNEIERIRQANAELLVDMDACRTREAELLEYTERLTSKNVMLQSDYAILENKNQMYELEQSRLSKLTEELEKQIELLKNQLEEEKQQRQQETQLLARKLAEKTLTVDNLNVKLDEEMNENRVTKRRHAASVKELTREIQQLKRKIDLSESPQPLNSHLGISSGLGSRVSSTGSLDNSGSVFNNPTLASNNGTNKTQLTHNGPLDNVITVEPSRQLLIERIVKLQKSLARKNDKIEFLDEHVRQLIIELRKKSRIIQGYVMKLEPGALATEKMDQNKIDLSRRGGIMASVYSSHATDGAMTFELSLEINQKLQAVLEDTLLKNITLKENINTLGNEIARLTSKDEPNA